jgi:iron uptake system EfeUOB component EfeO/EfeM
MINLNKILTVTVLSASIALTGCAPKTTQQPVTQTKEQTQTTPAESQKTLSIADGAKNMRDALKGMKTKLNSKDEEGAIKISSQLEENWKVIEDSVKDKNKEAYAGVEGPLDTINGGVKVKPLDTKTITTAIDNLDKQLVEVEKIK